MLSQLLKERLSLPSNRLASEKSLYLELSSPLMGSSFTTAPPTSTEEQVALAFSSWTASAETAAAGGGSPTPPGAPAPGQEGGAAHSAAPGEDAPAGCGCPAGDGGKMVALQWQHLHQMGMQPVVSGHCLGVSSITWSLGD